MNIGRRIKERRLQLKMTADELSRRIGKDRSTVYRYESGGIDKISVDMVEPLAKALDTTPAFLMGLGRKSSEFASAHVVKNGICATYISTNAAQVRHMERWVTEIGHVEFSDEENEELIKFAKYLLFRRTASESPERQILS